MRKILILTSHGIRTNAKWQERLEEITEEEVEKYNKAIDNHPQESAGRQKLHVTFLHNDYKFFSIFSFINPFRRRGEVRKFEQRLRSYIESGEYDEIHLVGHSFGTHIIGHSLLRIGKDLNKKVGTVILAGSVLSGSFRWDDLFKTGIKRLVNECGDSDFILVLNAVLPFGSGLAGRRGFAGVTGDHFRNRFFRFGHSGYFEVREPDGPDELWFMRRYWVPLLLGEQTTPNVDERLDSFGHLFRGWVADQSEGLKWVVPVGLLAGAAFVFLYFALVWRTSFNLETLELAGRVIDDVERHQLHDVAAKVAERQALIDAQGSSAMTTFEAMFRGDARQSYTPEQWERARVAAKLAIPPRVSLAKESVDSVRFRGPDFATVTFARAVGPYEGEEKAEAKSTGPASIVYDLRTAQPSNSPMWEWAGPYAGRTSGDAHIPKQDGGSPFQRMTDLNLQGGLEHALAASLSSEALSIWDVTTEKQISAWAPSSWKKGRLIEARPCGSDGDAIAVGEDGRLGL